MNFLRHVLFNAAQRAELVKIRVNPPNPPLEKCPKTIIFLAGWLPRVHSPLFEKLWLRKSTVMGTRDSRDMNMFTRLNTASWFRLQKVAI